ncbi:MAG: leucine--tRNA ligase [Candidatus Freyarchaeota archaeon]
MALDWDLIEEKWQKRWSQAKLFKADPPPKSERTGKWRRGLLVTFPYPYLNGRLHLGHAFTCLRVDIYARFKRMQGFNVLFPFAFHATGEPIVGVAERISKGDEKQIDILVKGGVPESEVEKFKDPHYIVQYYRREAIRDVARIGFSVDWRRQFTTIDPRYNRFIEWQYLRLKDLGYVVIGTHPVIWCPNCESPTGDHDRLVGEGVSYVEFTLLKFELDGAFLMAATLRPETVFGVTNMWVNPDGDYVRAKVNGEMWIVSEEAAFKLKEQGKQVNVLERFKGAELVGRYCKNLVVGNEVPILPASFVDPGNASGVVMSVPSHAPYDWAAIKELRENPETLEEYGLPIDVVAKLKPISLIKTEGLGEHPAIEAVDKAGIRTQLDPRLDELTKDVYRKEFHKGVLKEITGKYRGLPVREVKQRLMDDFKAEGKADSMYECADTVICRCNTKCIVKILENQWFLRYSDPEWKAKVRRQLNRMVILPDEARNAFENTVEWLEDKACVRKTGLGTRLPWDPEWIVETLSDSTIYMAFYTIAKHLNMLNVSADKLVPEVFDYVFLGEGSLDEVASKSGLDRNVLEAMRDEFEYWYPVELRVSAKELVFNHLTFFLFHHVALWPEGKWPRKIGVNGMIQVEGEKMAKSKGNFITMREALNKYGADVTRMSLAYAAEGLNDPDWREKEVQGLRRRLETFYEFATNLPQTKPLNREIDRWLRSRLHRRIKAVTENYDNLKTRSAIQEGFFNLWNDIRWYMRRTQEYGDILKEAIKTMVLLLAPVAPHICEEIWEKIGGKQLIAMERWPEYREEYIDEQIEAKEQLVESLTDDIKEILKVTNIKKPKKIVLFASPSWKYTILKEALKGRENLIKRVMQIPEIRQHGKDAVKYAEKLVRDLPSVTLTQEEEVNALNEAKSFIEREFKAKVEVILADESTHEKAKVAEPLKPGIYIE